MKRYAYTTLALLAAFLVAFIGSGGCTHDEVKPDDMSAQAHHEKAQKEEKAAAQETQIARTEWPNEPMNTVAIPEQYLSQTGEDPQTLHLDRARYLEQHAQEHERAAAELEKFEDIECKSLPASKRSACPMLGPIAGTQDIDGGVRIRYREGADVKSVLPLMRCHYAYARAHGFEDAKDCPLYIRGEEFRQAPEANAVDIVSKDSKDSKTVAEIRKRVHAGREASR